MKTTNPPFVLKCVQLLSILCLAATGVTVPIHAATTPETKVAARGSIEKFLKCWETGDRVTFAAMLHPDLVFGYPGGRFNRESLLQTFDRYQKQKKDIRIYFGDKFVSDGSKHILNYQFAATDRSTGKRFAVGTAIICQMTDGKFIAFREYWDTGVPEQQKAGELPLDEGQVSPWPMSVWLRADEIN